MLRMEKLVENILAQFIMKPSNLEDYDHLKITILVNLVTGTSSASIDILLGCKDGWYKRIPTKEHIILSHPAKLMALEIIFIE